MTPGGKYTRLLSPGAMALNNGTTTGGLAYALQQGLQGMIAGDERRTESDRKKGLAEALKAMMPGTMAPGQNPAAGPGMMAAAPAAQPNPRQAAIAQLAQTDPELAFQMVNSDYAAEQDRKGREQALADQRSMYLFEQNNRAQAPRNVQTVTTDAGVFVLNPDGSLGNKLGANPDAPTGPFEGTGMDAQAYNILLMGDPSSPAYAAMYNRLAAPKVTVDPQTGAITTVQPDMSAFRTPFAAQQPVPQQAAAPVSGEGAAMQTSVPGASVTTTEGKKPTEFNQNQSNAATYADRMMASEGILAAVANQGTDFWSNIKARYPGGNHLLSPEYQKFDQAKRDFVNAQLRQESGAVISAEEFENAERQYFPVPGDSPEVIEQKRRNREIAIAGMRRAAGPAYVPPTIADGPAANLNGVPQQQDDDALINKYLGTSRD